MHGSESRRRGGFDPVVRIGGLGLDRIQMGTDRGPVGKGTGEDVRLSKTRSHGKPRKWTPIDSRLSFAAEHAGRLLGPERLGEQDAADFRPERRVARRQPFDFHDKSRFGVRGERVNRRKRHYVFVDPALRFRSGSADHLHHRFRLPARLLDAFRDLSGDDHFAGSQRPRVLHANRVGRSLSDRDGSFESLTDICSAGMPMISNADSTGRSGPIDFVRAVARRPP